MKQTVWNSRWILCVSGFLLMTVFGALSFDDDPWLAAAIVAVGLLLILGYAFVMPHRYTFSKEGIGVRYGFGVGTFLRWRDVRYIEDHYGDSRLFPWLREYEIGYFQSKLPFHQSAALPKNRRITRLLNRYLPGKIEKFG